MPLRRLVGLCLRGASNSDCRIFGMLSDALGRKTSLAPTGPTGAAQRRRFEDRTGVSQCSTAYPVESAVSPILNFCQEALTAAGFEIRRHKVQLQTVLRRCGGQSCTVPKRPVTDATLEVCCGGPPRRRQGSSSCSCVALEVRCREQTYNCSDLVVASF